MYLHRHFAASLSFFTVLAAVTSSAPTTQSAFSHLPGAAAHDPSTVTLLQQPSNNSSSSITGPKVAQRVNNTSDSSIPESGPSSATNRSTTEVTYWAGTWDISSTLSLNIDIGQWRLSPESVLGTLEAAENAVGKKEPAGLLEGKFTQKTGSRLNTMVFEVGPVPKEEGGLNWKDVADMLGEERGLPRFFRETKEWHNVDFELVHSERGLLGRGMVRKWYMLDFERNATGLEMV